METTKAVLCSVQLCLHAKLISMLTSLVVVVLKGEEVKLLVYSFLATGTKRCRLQRSTVKGHFLLPCFK